MAKWLNKILLEDKYFFRYKSKLFKPYVFTKTVNYTKCVGNIFLLLLIFDLNIL